MADKCGDSCGSQSFEGLSDTYKKILWVVVAINGLMFLVEIIAGFLADSTALKADALDFLGDTATYGVTLLVIGKSLKTRAMAALLKGLSLGAMALFVLGFTLYRVVVIGEPEPLTMGAIGFLALLANMVSVLLLLKYREGDSNIRSVWLCSVAPATQVALKSNAFGTLEPADGHPGSCCNWSTVQTPTLIGSVPPTDWNVAASVPPS